RVAQIGVARTDLGEIARKVLGDDLSGIAEGAHLALIQPEAPRRELRDRRHVVADEQHRPSLAADLAHLPEALPLESGVSDREHLVDDQDVRLQMRRYREREP